MLGKGHAAQKLRNDLFAVGGRQLAQLSEDGFDVATHAKRLLPGPAPSQGLALVPSG